MNASSSKTNKLTVGEWLKLKTEHLMDAGISSARLDCLILLEQRLPKNRASILAHLDDELTDEQLRKLDNDVRLRIQHKPTSYITGSKEFYGRQFLVSEDVLVPRPETESIITLLKTLPKPKTIIDVGTGSGCLAITAKLEVPDASVYALDIDEKCLDIARQNATKLGADIELVKSDLLASLSTEHNSLSTVVLANLPYVPDDDPVNEAAKHEPTLALYGGADGLDLYRKLWQQIGGLSANPAAVICESSLPMQHEFLAEIAKHHDFSLTKTDGLAQLYQP